MVWGLGWLEELGGGAQSVPENTLMLGYRLASLVLPLTGLCGRTRMTFPFFPVSSQDALFCPTLCEVMPTSCHKAPSYRAAAGSIWGAEAAWCCISCVHKDTVVCLAGAMEHGRINNYSRAGEIAQW